MSGRIGGNYTVRTIGQQDVNGMDVCLELATFKNGETDNCKSAIECIDAVGKHSFTAQSLRPCMQLASSPAQGEKAVQCVKDAAPKN